MMLSAKILYMKHALSEFVEFVREQGVVGLAVGFILGGSVSKIVTSITNDLINPLVALILGSAGDLRTMTWHVGRANIGWGNFLGTFIDFVVIAIVVFLGVKILKLDRLDKKKK